MSVLLFGCFLFSFMSVSLGRGESQTGFAPYHHHAAPSSSRLNSLLRLFSKMHQLTGSVNPSPYGHLERGRPYYYPSPMMPEYPMMDYYPPVYPHPADDFFYPNYPPSPIFDQRYVGYPEESHPYEYGGSLAGYNEDALIADYLMSTLSSLQPVFNQKPFKNKIAAVIIPSPLRGPFGNPQQVSQQGIHFSETAGPSDKDATTITDGVSIGTIVKDLAASDADVVSLGPAVPL